MPRTTLGWNVSVTYTANFHFFILRNRQKPGTHRSERNGSKFQCDSEFFSRTCTMPSTHSGARGADASAAGGAPPEDIVRNEPTQEQREVLYNTCRTIDLWGASMSHTRTHTYLWGKEPTACVAFRLRVDEEKLAHSEEEPSIKEGSELRSPKYPTSSKRAEASIFLLNFTDTGLSLC